MRRSAAWFFGASALAGCSFTEVPPAPDSVAINQCEEDSECGGGRCRNNMCSVTSTTLRELLVEVTPATSDQILGGSPFYARLDAPAGDIKIGPAGFVTTSIVAALKNDSPCRFLGPPASPLERPELGPSGGTITAAVSFIQSERVLGIPTPTYLTNTGKGEGFKPDDQYTATTKLPPGVYDIYVEPNEVMVPDVTPCDVPPLLVRGQELSGTVRLALELPEKSLLDLHVRGPSGDVSLTGWSVAVLDSVSGRVLSVPKTLPPPAQSEEYSEYTQKVPFVVAHVVEEGTLARDKALAGNEIVRLSPPDDRVAPSFYFQRDALRLSNDPAAPDIISLTPPNGYSSPATPLPALVTIEGQTTETDTGSPVAAAVTLLSDTLEGASRQASYITTIQVDDDGWFRTEVPAGDYFVRATPPFSLGLSAAEAYWNLRADLQAGVQAGKTIELPNAPQVTGEAFAHGNRPVFGATATTVVSPFSIQNTVLSRTLEKPEVVPRASADLVQVDGRFAVSVDPGRYDFFIRPEARSHYPWLVLPNVEVPEGGLELQRRRITLPFVYRGDVVVDETMNRVPGALVRAYASVTVTDPGTSTTKTAVVPVAEARTDETGAFELLIPASLDER
jgi:hypothetical protein